MRHLLRKYDVVPLGRNDAMFAPNIAEDKDHSKKPNLSGRQIGLYCCERATKSSMDLLFVPYLSA